MKLNTQAAKHLIKKPGQSSLLRHARLAGSSLCFFAPEGSRAFLQSAWMEKWIAKAKTIGNLILEIHIWDMNQWMEETLEGNLCLY